MRRFWVMIATIGLGAALLLGGPSDAWAQWRHGGGWHGGGWHGGGWHGGGWRGAGWPGGGWRGAGWNGGWGWNRPGWSGIGWRSGWNRGWGWNRGLGWGGGGWWPATAGLGLGWGATSPYWGSGWDWGYGGPYYDSYYPSYAYGSPTYFGAYQTRPYYAYARTGPLMTGRSVATGNIGMHCATSIKTCLLKNASYVGAGCSCKVTGGRARGSVTP